MPTVRPTADSSWPCRLVRSVGVLVVALHLTTALADHGAPPPRLGGLTLCLDRASVRLGLEATTLPGPLASRVVTGAFDRATATLTGQKVPLRTNCERADGYVLLELYARFLDPKTYLGFPANSYTYVVTTQVGQKPADAAQTVLPNGRYVASTSDIIQAATPENLTEHLVSLGEAQARALAATWRAANVVPARSYAVFAALGMSLLALRGLTAVLGRSG